MRILSIFFLSVMMFVQGCGYTTKTALAPEWKRIYISPVINDIDFTNQYDRNLYTPLLEVKIRNAISERFLVDGHLQIVDRPEDADLGLQVWLTDFRHDPLRYEGRAVSEWRVAIVVRMEVADNRRHKVLWQVESIAGSEDRFRLGSQTSSEDVAVDAAVTDLSRQIVEATIQHW